jgi:DNA-binding ferritin-like protein
MPTSQTPAMNDTTKPEANAWSGIEITLTGEAIKDLAELAELQGISKDSNNKQWVQEVLTRAISDEFYIRQELKKGSNILVERTDNSIKRVVFRQ